MRAYSEDEHRIRVVGIGTKAFLLEAALLTWDGRTVYNQKIVSS